MSVTALTRRIKWALEEGIGKVLVEGEVSGFRPAASGHVYFSLKDEHSLIDAVLWRSSAAKLPFIPRDGERVVAKGEITVYEPRGRYQLVVTSLQPAGAGDLQRRFEELKAKLEAEGLFAYSRKKPLPAAPRTVGLVTSATGAALRDMMKIFKRRAPGIRLVLSPCLVQGKDAAADIVRALRELDAWGETDVIIVGRGGGSIEDLWPFNEEIVARAIASARTPVVSAVGHETDVTIADLVADFRAATPSEAAETVSPDQTALAELVLGMRRRLSLALERHIAHSRMVLNHLADSPAFRRPWEAIQRRWQSIDEINVAMRIGAERKTIQARSRFEVAAAKLSGLSPLAVLSRGYAVVRGDYGQTIRSANMVDKGDEVSILLSEGEISAVVSGRGEKSFLNQTEHFSKNP